MITAEHLRKTFPGKGQDKTPVVAVDDVGFEAHDGEITGLLGPNGAGKTTTLRMLAGILPPTEGTVTVAGIDVHARPLEAKPRIGFLSGDTQLYQRLSPREVLRYFGRLYGLERAPLEARIEQLVAELVMAPFADRPCATLSAGQKKRLGLARLWLSPAPLWLLDEPYANLDLDGIDLVNRMVQAHLHEGGAALVTTHGAYAAPPVRTRLLELSRPAT